MAQFEILKAPADLRAAQQSLERVLSAAMPVRPGTYTVGYQSNSHKTSDLRANAEIWHFHQVVSEGTPRYWNAFGLTSNLRPNQ